MIVTRFACPGCGAVLKAVRPIPAGKQVKCPQCKSRFVPAPLIQPSPPIEEAASERKAETPPPADAQKTLQGGGPHQDKNASGWEEENFLPKVPGYLLLAELGRGGMGVVYKARQLSLDRLVALKMILAGPLAGPQEVARFRTEAAAVARLQHPHIVQIYEVGEQDGLPFLALEFVNGPTLARRIAGSPQSARRSAELIETLARAIAVAHERGIIHRDLKPGNVLLGQSPTGSAEPAWLERPFGIPKITDFGLAKRLDSDAGQTRTGVFLGTPSYVAPEQARGQPQDIGPATDIYSLGAILYELLTGRPPFRGNSAYETLDKVTRDDAVPPSRFQSNVPRDLEAICLKCLNKASHNRYPSAVALADDLRRFLNGEPTHVRPPGPADRLKRWCLNYPVPASLLLAFTFCLVFGFWYMTRLSDQLVHAAALENAVQQSDVLREVNDSYSEVVKRAQAGKLEVRHDYQEHPAAIPIPATFTIELGQQISDRSDTGVQIRLYSAYPFRSRRNGGPRDDFEREAWRRLCENPAEPVYRFEDYKGRPSLRYATPRLMQETCVHCHNSHPDSPKTDWKVGDVRGVVEIIHPLDSDAVRVHKGLWGAFVFIGAVCASLLGLAGLVLLAGRVRRRRRA